ncbi:hypothetical protein M0804_006563 [Polistes exclamans]|nr:hypothetical protein M0804_006563 [Polistes exclamans]
MFIHCEEPLAKDFPSIPAKGHTCPSSIWKPRLNSIPAKLPPRVYSLVSLEAAASSLGCHASRHWKSAAVL